MADYKKREVRDIVKHEIKRELWKNNVEYGGSTSLNNMIDRITENFWEYHSRNASTNPHLSIPIEAINELREECCSKVSSRIINNNDKIKRRDVIRQMKALIKRTKNQCGIVFLCHQPD